MGKISALGGVTLLLTFTVVVAAALALFSAGKSQLTGLGSAGEVQLVSEGELKGSAMGQGRRDSLAGAAEPEVVLSRDLAAGDLLGLGVCPTVDAADPRYRLVVMRGDFDLSNIPGMGKMSPTAAHYKYIAYVYDAAVGSNAPTQTIASPNGGSFRELLGDPTLPDDVPPGSPPGTRQANLRMDPAECDSGLQPQGDPEQAAPTAPSVP